MNLTWDEIKRQANLKKHGLDSADAELVFSGYTLTRPDTRFAYSELRYSTIGLLGVEVVVIAHTETVDEIRIIYAKSKTLWTRKLLCQYLMNSMKRLSGRLMILKKQRIELD